MSDPALGTNAVVAIDFEQSWGTAKGSPDGRKIAVLSNGMTGTQEMLDNPNLGGDFNPRDATSGKKAASGSLVFVPNITMLPLILDWLTNSIASTGSADPYTHVFKLGSAVPKSCVLETDFLVGASHKFAIASGVRINRLTIPIDAAGFLQMSADLIAKDVLVGDTAYDASLTDWTLATPFEHLQLASADVKLDTVAIGYVLGGSINVNANLYADDYRVGAGGARGSLVPGRHSIDGSLRIALDNTAVMAMLAGGAAHALSFKWTCTTNRTFQLDLPRVIFQKTQPTLNDAGPVIVEAQFRASKDSGEATAFKATVVNDQAGTVYA